MNILSISILAISISTTYSFDYSQCDNYESNFMNRIGEIIDVATLCKSGVCIAKCCRDGYVLQDKTCQEKSNIQKDIKNKTGKYVQLDYKELQFYDGSAEAEDDIIFLYNKVFGYGSSCTYEPGEIERLLKNGSLYSMLAETEVTLKQLHFCVEYKYNANRAKVKLVYIKLYNDVIQNPGRLNQENKTRLFFNVLCLLVSVFFLLLVVIVHILLRMYKKLADMMMLAYLITFTTSYLTMSVIFTQQLNGIDIGTCNTVYPVYFIIWLATFFWLTVMSFDVWWTVRDNRAIQRRKKTSTNKKFLLYCLYAYGSPLAIGAIAITIDSSDLDIEKPSFNTCMVDLYPNLYYKQIPISILTLINSGLFVMTLKKIWTIKRNLSQCKNSRRHINTQSRFKMYLKIGFLMGVNWLVEVVEIVIETFTYRPLWLKLVLDSYNGIVGLVIFILFVCNAATLVKLAGRFNIKNDYVERLRLKKPGIEVSSFTATSRDA